MKKLISVLLVVLFIGSFAFASNNQKIYSIDDQIVSDIKTLGRLTGHALLSSSGPWSGDELLDYMDALRDEGSIDGSSEGIRKLYADIKAVLTEDSQGTAFETGIQFSLEGNIHKNTDEAFQTRDNWVRDFNRSQPMFKLSEENHIGENLYGYFEFSLGVAMHHLPSQDFGSTAFSSNILMLGNNTVNELDFNFPKRTLISVGSDCFNLIIGRDRLSWGNGTTGNLIIGNQIQYHNMLKASAWADNFKYTYLISAFPHPQNYYDGSGVQTNGVGGGQSHYMNGISSFIAHRLEWTLGGKLNIALSEGIIYMSKDNKIDLMSFMPSMLYHNNYTRANSNSILGLEFDWAAAKGLNIYGQLAVDEFTLPGEAQPGKSELPAEPNSLGLLAGATYSMQAAKGFLTLNAEGAYTSPYLYLRDGDNQAGEVGGSWPVEEWRVQTKGKYGINYVVAVREMIGAGGTEYYDEQFLGYKYGPDAIVMNANASYDVDKLKASLNGFYMLHGTHDKWTIWTQVNRTYENKVTPTTDHQTENQKDDDVSDRTEIEKTMVLGASVSYEFKFGLSAFAQLDFINIKNKGNVSGNDKADIQMTVALTYAL